MADETVELSVTSTQINTGVQKANGITKTATQINSSLALADSAIQSTDVATSSAVGVVKPDGTTITVTSDGTISSVGGSGTVTDVQVNGTSVVTSGVANVPTATSSRVGVITVSTAMGSQILSGYAGLIAGYPKDASTYVGSNANMFIAKGTLDNVVTGIYQTITDSSTTALTKNYIYSIATATALTFTYPSTYDNSFIAEVDFTSGSTATTLTIPSGTYCKGDDCSNGTFTPTTNKRYACIFYYDGASFVCVVSGRSVS